MTKITAAGLADRYTDATPDEVVALKKLAGILPPNPIIVNIGAGNRAISTLALLEARPDSVVFSIDIKVKENERIYLEKAGLEWRRVIRVLGNSQIIGRVWPFEVDMAYVDGDHRFKGVRNDIMAWLPKIRAGGIIALHDYVDLDGNPTDAGRAINKFMRREQILRADRLIAFWQKDKDG